MLKKDKSEKETFEALSAKIFTIYIFENFFDKLEYYFF